MNRRVVVGALTCACFSIGMSTTVHGQAQDAGLEKQLRAEYVVASIGSDGTVIQPGTVVVLQQPAVTALQVTPQISPDSSYWPNNYKMGGHVKTSGV